MATLQVKKADTPDESRPFKDGKGQADIVELDGQMVGRATFEPGWRWSEHVKPIAGTDSCQTHHVAYVVSGRMGMRMDDGTEAEVAAGDFFVCPPGHDAWVLGDEAMVAIDWGSAAATYAKGKA
jgi:quercetin dioxygenase-like cupin family protein